jgi:ankyrin repeat protein
MAGAPLGNTNAKKAKPWAAAIERALEKRSRVKQLESLDELAETFLSACDAGDLAALKELGDRLDGKANQSISGPDGTAIPVGIKVSFERPG